MSKEAIKLALALATIHHTDDEYPELRQKVRRLAKEALAEQPAQQEPVALKWQQSPIRTAWGDDMVVASVAIDNDHTLSLYCERDQTPKVNAMFAQRTWVGLTEDEVTLCHSLAVLSKKHDGTDPSFTTLLHQQIEAKLKEKNT